MPVLVICPAVPSAVKTPALANVVPVKERPVPLVYVVSISVAQLNDVPFQVNFCPAVHDVDVKPLTETVGFCVVPPIVIAELGPPLTTPVTLLLNVVQSAEVRSPRLVADDEGRLSV